MEEHKEESRKEVTRREECCTADITVISLLN